MTKEKMVDVLMSEPAGKIVACNVIDGIENNVIDESDVKMFMALWYSEFKKDSSANLKKLIGMITTTAMESVKSGSKIYCGCGCKPSSDKGGIKFHHITTYRALLTFVVDKARFQRRLGVGTPIPPSNADISNRALHRLFKNDTLFKSPIDARDDGMIGRDNWVFWATPNFDIKNSLSITNTNDRANRIRERLGLVHHSPSNRETPALMSVVISGRMLVGRRSRPCFVEAGSHLRFRTVPDRDVNRRKKEWGYTVDLMKINNGSAEVDGVRECVVRSIPCSMLRSINLTPIGIVSTDIGSNDVDTNKFSDLLMSNRDEIALKKKLLTLLC